MTLLYRSMKSAPDGLPECGPSRRQLGAKVPEDIDVENGNVLPVTGGMSVSPDRAENLPQHRRPPQFGGTGKDGVSVIRSSAMGQNLIYRPDPRDVEHGFVEPAQKQSLDHYQQALCLTRKDWIPA
jgi:hypothetical protein